MPRILYLSVSVVIAHAYDLNLCPLVHWRITNGRRSLRGEYFTPRASNGINDGSLSFKSMSRSLLTSAPSAPKQLYATDPGLPLSFIYGEYTRSAINVSLKAIGAQCKLFFITFCPILHPDLRIRADLHDLITPHAYYLCLMPQNLSVASSVMPQLYREYSCLTPSIFSHSSTSLSSPCCSSSIYLYSRWGGLPCYWPCSVHHHLPVCFHALIDTMWLPTLLVRFAAFKDRRVLEVRPLKPRP